MRRSTSEPTAREWRAARGRLYRWSAKERPTTSGACARSAVKLLVRIVLGQTDAQMDAKDIERMGKK